MNTLTKAKLEAIITYDKNNNFDHEALKTSSEQEINEFYNTLKGSLIASEAADIDKLVEKANGEAGVEMGNTNKGVITIKNGATTISAPKSAEGLMDMVTTSMAELRGEVVLVAAHGYHFEQRGHTTYVSSQGEVDILLKQIKRCYCRECSVFRMQCDIRQRRVSRA